MGDPGVKVAVLVSSRSVNNLHSGRRLTSVMQVGQRIGGQVPSTVVEWLGQPGLFGHTVVVVVTCLSQAIKGHFNSEIGQGIGLVAVVVGQGQSRGATKSLSARTLLHVSL
jgi:hypothetical protein